MATEDPSSSGVEDSSAASEGPGVDLSCVGSSGRSFHDAFSGTASATDTDAVKVWRCGGCEKIAINT